MSLQKLNNGFSLLYSSKASLSFTELEITPCYGNALFYAVFPSTLKPVQGSELDLSMTQSPTSTHTDTNTALRARQCL